MNIIKDLELSGWKILKIEDQMIFAERRSTGKQGFFISDTSVGEIGETEIARVWTKKSFHPFVFKETDQGIIYYDFLFDEFIKKP